MTGEPLSRFDTETHKFTNYWETGHTYSLVNDFKGDLWFTITGTPGQVAKMDWQTLKMTRYPVPTKDGLPRRIQIDSKGTILVRRIQQGQIGRFDPQTEMFAGVRFAYGSADASIWLRHRCEGKYLVFVLLF